MASSKKKIAVVTGIRSEYHILQPVMRAIQENKALSLQVIVTGTHLSSRFGSTWRQVAADFPIKAKVSSFVDGDHLADRSLGLGKQILGLTKTLEKLKPDITCVLGDREESLAVASSCAFLNRAVAHISGGDRGMGTVDDSVRHAVSKLAHLHFPTTQENRQRLLQLGEESWRIHVVGASGLDRLRQVKKISRKEFLKKVQLPEGDYVVVLQHPVTAQTRQAAKQMNLTLKAVKKTGLGAVIIHPNSDAGSQAMIQTIKKFSKPKNWQIFVTLDDLLWVNSLRHATALVGNSSAGLIEAPFLACPAINIGLRQTQRTAGKNLLRVSYSTEAIKKALKKVQQKSWRESLKKSQNRHLYGNGRTGPKIAKILSEIFVDDRLLTKKITY